MKRLRKVIVEDSYPALVIILTSSLLISFVDSLVIKLMLTPFVVYFSFVVHKKLRPNWFVSKEVCAIYFFGLLFIIFFFNYIVVFSLF